MFKTLFRKKQSELPITTQENVDVRVCYRITAKKIDNSDKILFDDMTVVFSDGTKKKYKNVRNFKNSTIYITFNCQDNMGNHQKTHVIYNNRVKEIIYDSFKVGNELLISHCGYHFDDELMTLDYNDNLTTLENVESKFDLIVKKIGLSSDCAVRLVSVDEQTYNKILN